MSAEHQTISTEAIQAASRAIRDGLHKNISLWEIATKALEAAEATK